MDRKGTWNLVVPFETLEKLKDKTRIVTVVLRRYEGLVEERPDLLESLKRVSSKPPNTFTQAPG